MVQHEEDEWAMVDLEAGEGEDTPFAEEGIGAASGDEDGADALLEADWLIASDPDLEAPGPLAVKEEYTIDELVRPAC